MSLRISDSLSFPITFVTEVTAYLAKRGAGKTYCAAVQAEEMLKAGVPIVVIDGMGIWWGLRVGKDGSGDGYPVVVFGGEHADLPLSVDKAEDIARAVVASNISCVLDLSDFSLGQSKKVLTLFLNELYKLNRQDRHVFIEEADQWAPQRTIGPEEAVCLGAVDNFVRRGGNRNLGCTLITQRSAVLNKNILTQADSLVILRTLAPQDKDAIESWVEKQTDESNKTLKKWYDSLNGLENGEAWVWHPEKPTIYQKVQFRQRETFHATREFIKSPTAGGIRLMSVDEFLAKYQDAFQGKKVIEGQSGKLKDRHLASLPAGDKLASGSESRHNQSAGPTSTKSGDREDLSHGPKTESPKPVGGAIPPLPLSPEKDKKPVEEIHIEEKALVVKITHTEIIIRQTTENLRGQVLFILYHAQRPLSQPDIIREANEHGWAMSPKSLAVSMLNYVEQGFVVQEEERGPYRLPRFVRYDVKEIQA